MPLYNKGFIFTVKSLLPPPCILINNRAAIYNLYPTGPPHMLCLVIVLLIAGNMAIAQPISNLKKAYCYSDVDSFLLDSCLILPNSATLWLDSTLLSNAFFTITPNGYFKWNDSLKQSRPLQKALMIQYRVLPFNLFKNYNHKPTSLINKGSSFTNNPFSYNASENSVDLFKFDGLQKNGSISRGISFGNAQDVFVNSTLNLQLQGRIADDVNIIAAITDDNIPIQPDGNTQQLQDFDRVFIQVFNKNNALTAGDFVLTRPNSFFMNYFKKSQGANFTTTNYLKNDTVNNKRLLKNSIALAITRGRFARNNIAPIEGNQGPYRLTGANNENFIIILANTERVFIDGELLTRGQENDYVIDYNTGEVQFMPKRIITKDKRILIEFEYTERSYARTLLLSTNEFESKKLKARFHIYSEQDSKNQPLQATLDSSQKIFLSAIGDSIQQALYATLDSVSFNNNLVMYAKKDSTINGVIYDPIYVYSTNPDSAFFTASFNFVGNNKGNYIQDANAANGKVFKWVAPTAGIPQGAYEPVTLLVTPKRQLLAIGGFDYQLTNNLSIGTEMALSNYNVNLFSSKQKNDDQGYANRSYIQHKYSYQNKKSHKINWNNSLNLEHTSSNFKPLERYRNIEFDRDWNIGIAPAKKYENIVLFNSKYEHSQNGSLLYQLQSYDRGIGYNGLMNAIAVNYKLYDFFLVGNASLLSIKGNALNSDYLRHQFDFGKRISKFVIGIKELTERNMSKRDSLLPNSFAFEERGAYAGYNDTGKVSLLLNYKMRKDELPKNDELALATTGNDASLIAEMINKKGNSWRITSTYRTLSINDSTLYKLPPQQTFLNRIELNSKYWKGVIVNNTFYEVGNGRELRKDFSYLEVPAGQGAYTWRDYNSNGIKELDEFEIAQFTNEATYLRVFTPTNQFINTRTNVFSEVLQLNPGAHYSTGTSKPSFISRFNNLLAIRFEKKTQNEDLLTSLNSFEQAIEDTNLLNTSVSIRNTLFFNRSSSIWGADFTFQETRNKTLLVNGFETRALRNPNVNLRWNINRYFLINQFAELGNKKNESEFFSSRNFNIESFGLEPKLTYQPSINFRLSLAYRLAEKKNTLSGSGETLKQQRGTLEAKFTSINNAIIATKISVIDLKYNAATNTALAYDMLEGLNPGSNYTWNISIQKNLSNSMQINLNYDGRKPESVATIHTGSVQFRAFF
jgi:hypothetical protein